MWSNVSIQLFLIDLLKCVYEDSDQLLWHTSCDDWDFISPPNDTGLSQKNHKKSLPTNPIFFWSCERKPTIFFLGPIQIRYRSFLNVFLHHPQRRTSTRRPGFPWSLFFRNSTYFRKLENPAGKVLLFSMYCQNPGLVLTFWFRQFSEDWTRILWFLFLWSPFVLSPSWT